jgi:xyloglucan-specific endo-beta-1,4-glucanase
LIPPDPDTSASYTGSNIVGDISYDIYLGHTATGQASYEVMIWLASLGGAFPMSYTSDAIATLTIAGISFHLYKGPRGGHGASAIFTFVADSDQPSHSGDLLNFFQYLVDNAGVSSSLYLQSNGAGIEAFTGSSVVFRTTTYSMSAA